MRLSIIFFLGILLINIGSIDAQKEKDNVSPIINVSWETTEHNFGEINDQPVSFLFKFTNLKEEPMFIDNVRTTCGCTAPDWTYDPIPAGFEEVIKITFTAKTVGVFEKKIKVYLKDQRKPEILTISGDVVSMNEEGK